MVDTLLSSLAAVGGRWDGAGGHHQRWGWGGRASLLPRGGVDIIHGTEDESVSGVWCLYDRGVLTCHGRHHIDDTACSCISM